MHIRISDEEAGAIVEFGLFPIQIQLNRLSLACRAKPFGESSKILPLKHRIQVAGIRRHGPSGQSHLRREPRPEGGAIRLRGSDHLGYCR